MDTVEIKAFGKVNLGLDVVGRRPDGYHLVKMIMQTVDVYDVVTVSYECVKNPESRNSMPFFVSLSCDNPKVPSDESNLAYQAARIVGEAYHLQGTVQITIAKNIPMAAGMAGGSADAAAVIEAMDQLFGLSMTQETKDAFALRLGADVPFCLRRGTYLAEGIGEKLSRLTGLAPCRMVIVKPDAGVSTPWAYRILDQYLENPEKKGKVVHPDIDGLEQAISDRDILAISEKMGNILEPVVEDAYPAVREIKEQLESLGAVKAMMSGSGPTVFGIFKNKEEADHAFLNLGGGEYGKFEVEFR